MKKKKNRGIIQRNCKSFFYVSKKEIEKKKLDSEKAWQKQLADKEQSIIQLETKCQTLQEIIEAKDTTIKTLTASEVILQNEVQALKNRDFEYKEEQRLFRARTRNSTKTDQKFEMKNWSKLN